MAQHRRFHTPGKLLLLTLISFSPGGAAFAQGNPSAEKTESEREISAARETPPLPPSAATPVADRIGVGPTFQRFGAAVAFDVLANIVFREFGPDIEKIFKR